MRGWPGRCELIFEDKVRDVVLDIQKGKVELLKKLEKSQCTSKDRNGVETTRRDALLQVACTSGNLEAVKHLVEDGVKLSVPPELSQYTDQDYRRSTYLIQGIKSGKADLVEYLLEKGAKLGEVGSICISKKHGNNVVSNVIGCAAYHGKTAVLKMLLPKAAKSDIEFKPSEEEDKEKLSWSEASEEKKDGSAPPATKELSGYTPLMLSVTNDCV